MDPFTLGAIVASLVASLSDNLTNEALKGGRSAVSRIASWLRDKFSSDPEGEEASALNLVEKAPDSPLLIRALAELIDRRAQEDDEFRSELEALVTEAKESGTDIEGITQTVWGDRNVQNAGIVDSEIHITYGD
jgi:hypothetical protein